MLNKNRVIEAKQNFTGEAKNQNLPFVAPLDNFSTFFLLQIEENFPRSHAIH